MNNANTINKNADLIFKDLRERKIQRQSEIMNITGLMKAKHELILAAMPKHSIFIDKGEVRYLLKKKLTRAQTRLEFINQKLNGINHRTELQEETNHEYK